MLGLSKKKKQHKEASVNMHAVVHSCTDSFILAYVNTCRCFPTSDSDRSTCTGNTKQPDTQQPIWFSLQTDTDSQFHLRLSGWEMKGLTNLLLSAGLLNGCHNSFPSHTYETYLWKESLVELRREHSLLFGRNEKITHFYEANLAAVGEHDHHYLNFDSEKSVSCLCTSVNSLKVLHMLR